MYKPVRMKKIRLFLASSEEMKAERVQFEIMIYRKCKLWIDKGIFLHLDIWEDITASFHPQGSQARANEFIEAADIFVLLVDSKIGPYSFEEFEKAFGQFSATSKPFIFTYFKKSPAPPQESLTAFQQKLSDLKHFYRYFDTVTDLENQFSKELDRLCLNSFTKHEQEEIPVNPPEQHAEKIYNIEHIQTGNFS
jgi:hypothetical protein